jgi:hypothetical protein
MVETVVAPKRWLVVVNALLAVGGLGLAAWCVIALLGAPLGGMRAPAYLILFVLVVVGSSRGFALWQQFSASGPARTALAIGKWILPLLLPFVVIHAVEGGVQSRQQALVARELAPLIAYADALGAQRFDPAQAPTPALKVPVHFREDERGYRLWLVVPTVDIDGATLRYDPATRSWQRRHNDLPTDDADLEGRCVLRGGQWRCAEDAPVAAGVARDDHVAPDMAVDAP